MTAAARCAWKFKKCGRIVEKTQINFRQAEHTFDKLELSDLYINTVKHYYTWLYYNQITTKLLNLQGDPVSSAFTVTDEKIAPYIDCNCIYFKTVSI